MLSLVIDFFIECTDLVRTGILLLCLRGKDEMEEENDTAEGGLKKDEVLFQLLFLPPFVCLPYFALFDLFFYLLGLLYLLELISFYGWTFLPCAGIQN